MRELHATVQIERQTVLERKYNKYGDMIIHIIVVNDPMDNARVIVAYENE